MTSRNIKINAKADVVCVSEALGDEPLQSGELLIRNEASLISTGTELSRVYALKKGVVYPVYPGYSSIGRVIDAGPLSGEHCSCGNSSGGECARGIAGGGKSADKLFAKGDRVLFSGAHKELQVFGVSEMSSLGMIVKLGKEFDCLSSVEASLLHLGLIAMNGILPAELKLGDSVCVFGLGVVGLLTALLYQASGARVLGIDTVENRAVHARSAGLENALAAEGGAQVQAVVDFFGKEPDITVDATGRSEGIINAIMCCGENGQVLLLGSPRTDYACNITEVFNRLHMKMITLRGAFNGRYPFYKKEGSRESIERNMNSFAALIKKGLVDPKRVVSHVVKPEAAMEAYDGLYNHPENYYCVAFDWT
jgi:threonine dehydrogenase-like Zn-dependent dehydrogenase